ncbi:MAG: hypothetical protein AB8I08_06045 [Sandaracinaceae bacterium]
MRGTLSGPIASVLVGLLLAGLAPPASAQIPDAPRQPSEADFAVARDAFVEGIAHAERHQHRRALAAFERSYRLSGSTAALFNLASTLRHLERYVDADEAVTRLLGMSDLDAETHSRAARVQEQARAQLATLTIRDVPTGQADVLVDGLVRARQTSRPLSVPLDPGLRVVRVELAGRPSYTWSNTVAPGASLETRAEYATPTSLDPIPTPVGTPIGGDASPNWPAILGVSFGVLAVAAGGIAIGLVLADPSIGPRTDLVIRLP